jgi:chaperonin GroEL
MKHISDVSLISAGDKSISSLICKGIDMVGRNGIIFVEEGNTVTDEIEIVEGLRFDQGFVSGYFVTDKERLEVVLQDAYILLTDKKITLVKNELIPVLDLVLKEKNLY